MKIKYSLAVCTVLLAVLMFSKIAAKGGMSIPAEILFSSTSKSSVANLIGQPNHARFNKSFFILLDADQYFLTGYSDEIYTFDYWLGIMFCGTPDYKVCDIRACGVVDGATIACVKESDKPDAKSFCKCTYKEPYPQTCGNPKLVFDVQNFYSDKPNEPDRYSTIHAVSFVTVCEITPENPMPTPPPPTEYYEVPMYPADGSQGLKLVMSWSIYTPIPGKSAYFWTMHTVVININTQSLGLALNKMGVSQLAKMLGKEKIREIAKMEGI